MSLRTLGRAAIDVIYPRRCVGCGAFGSFLCAPCDASISPTSEGARCLNCSARWEGGLNCPRCFPCDSLDLLAGATDMEGAARKMVHALKYRGLTELAPLMAARIAPLRSRHAFDVAVAVPLHTTRLRQRGFNQAELLLAALEWPAAEGALIRTRKTDAQVGMDALERRTNISGAFEWRGPSLRGIRIAIVDDVITTGATANECARALREQGARSVVALAFARASHDPRVDAPIDD